MGKKICWVSGFMASGLLLGTFVFFLGPVQARVNRLSAEKGYWLDMLTLAGGGGPGRKPPIPSVEDLPALVDACREAFVAEGVAVRTLNVERFGGAAGSTADAGGSLDYALVRLRWSGSWAGIERALAEMEKDGRLGIVVAEADLSDGGGEGLLQIYFRSVALLE